MTEIFRNTSLYTLGNILPKVGSFFLLPLYTSYLSSEEFGLVNSVLALNSVLIILFTFSLNSSLYRLLYDYSSDSEKKEFLGSVSFTIFIIATVLTLFVFSTSDYFSSIFQSIAFYPNIALSVGTAYFSIFSAVPQVYFQVQEKVGKYIALSVLHFLLTNLSLVFFVVILQKGSTGYLTGYLIAEIAIAIVYIGVTLKISKPIFKFHYAKNALAYSLPMIPASLAVWVMNLSDRVLIERFTNLEEVGLYSLSHRIAGLILILALAFKKALDPYFFKLVNSEYSNELVEQKVKQISSYFILVIIVLAFLLSLFSKEVIYIIFNQEYWKAYKFVPVISLGLVVSLLSSFYNLSFYQVKNTKIVMYISIIAAVGNIGLNLILIPIYGAMGAAWSTFMTFSIDIVLKIILSKKYYPINVNLKMLLSVSSLSILLIIVSEYIFSETDVYAALVCKILILSILASIYFFSSVGNCKKIYSSIIKRF